MFELLRQGKPSVSRAKEAECCASDSSDFRGAIQLVMMNHGHIPKVDHKDKDELERKRINNYRQPSQKIVKSKPMDFSKVNQTDNPINQDMFGENNKPMDFVKGVTMVNHLHNKSLIDTMDGEQIRAAV